MSNLVIATSLTAHDPLTLLQSSNDDPIAPRHAGLTTIPSDLIEKALDPSEDYHQWLRASALRLLSSNIGWKAVIKGGAQNCAEWLALAGVPQLESMIKAEGEFYARSIVCKLRDQGASSAPTLPVFPQVLNKKLDALCAIVNLSPLEKSILGIAVLFQVEPLLIQLEENLGHDLLVHSVPRIFGAMLGSPETAIKNLLSEGARLPASGLLSLDHTMGEGSLGSHLDFLTRSFAHRMLQDGPIMDVFACMVRSAPPCNLVESDYTHIQEQIDVAYHSLKAWQNGSAKSVTILLWGKPGVGKTNLARLLAEKAGLHATEIPASNENHTPISPKNRAKAARFAQALLQKADEVLILDECEEVFQSQFSGDLSESVSKSYLNQFLENPNAPPTILIGNDIDAFDEAMLRRFDICIHVPIPGRQQRLNILESTSEGALSALAMNTIADQALSPAILAKANRIARESVTASNNTLDIEKTTLLLLNQHQAAIGLPPIRIPEENGLGNGFDPRLTRTNHDLDVLKQGLMETRSGRLICSGVAGSGKSTMATWLANGIGLPLMSLKASDLLDPLVGGSEKKIRHAFETAQRDGAILEISEIDSFLYDRAKAHSQAQWLVTQVNEFLTALENYEGIFIASTNHEGALDEACQRRFDIHIKFDYPDSKTVRELYNRITASLALSSPSEQDLIHLDAIHNLTPGDFAAVKRKSRLIPIKSHADLLVHLKQIADWKPSSARRIGF